MNSARSNRLSLITGSQSALAQTLILLATFWPVWIWYGQRITDQSDEPLGIVALITLLYLLARQQAKRQTQTSNEAPAEPNASFNSTRQTSTIPSSSTALTALMALYALSLFFAPRLVSAALALISIGLYLRDQLNYRLNSGQWTLLLLSLPLVASLNFYLGYPLRLVVAQLAVSLLSLNGFPLRAEGTSLLWHNQLIEIDAPCSGIKMLWATLYLAAILLSLKHTKPAKAALYLGLAITTAIFANALRVTSLFYLEAGIIAAPTQLPQLLSAHFESAVHMGTGVATFFTVALILFFVDKQINRETTEAAETVDQEPKRVPSERERNGTSCRKQLLITCATAAILPFFSAPKAIIAEQETGNQTKWPTVYEGQKLRPQQLTASVAEFAKYFPGKIAVFQTDKQTIIYRHVNHATRQLHPAEDCYRASGFKIINRPSQIDKAGNSWNVLEAQKNKRRLEIRERIYDNSGHSYTEVSQWYWAALWGRTEAPWWSITTVEAIGSQESQSNQPDHQTNQPLQ